MTATSGLSRPDVELEGQILARLERQQRLCRRAASVERANVRTAGLATGISGNYSKPIGSVRPPGSAIWFLHPQAQLRQCHALLCALGKSRSKLRPISMRPESTRRSEKQPDGQTEFSSHQRVQCVK
jgi:hypothetical protein